MLDSGATAVEVGRPQPVAEDADVLRHLILILTYRCQLRCKMCGQVDAPIEAPNSQQNKTMLPTELTLIRLDEVPNLSSLYLFGGEPLLHRDIFKILKYASDRKVKAMFSTNGLLLSKFAAQIIEYAPAVISISLDSHIPEIHDKIRGLKGSFERALQAIDGFLTQRAAAGVKRPRLKIHCTITPDNYKSMREFHAYMFERFPEADDIRFHFPRFATSAMGKAYEEVMIREFGSGSMSWLGNFSNDELTNEFMQMDTGELAAAVGDLLQRPKASITGPTDPAEIDSFFRNPGEMPEGRTCACFGSVAIQPDGKVVMCADYPDYVMGNIADDSLIDIWNSERARKWRRYLRENGNPGVLVKCSRLYDITAAPAAKN